jgi:DNA-binding CsgD family transcriptional regulator
MPNSRAEFRRLVRTIVQHELGRAGLSALLLGYLLIADFHIAIVLALPAVFYAGLWLLADPRQSPVEELLSYQQVREAFQDCVQLHGHIQSMAESIADARIAGIAVRIASCAERIIDVLADEEKLDAAVALRKPLKSADDIMTRYARITRRGLDSPEVQERVLSYLESLERALGRFWTRLGEEAVVDLQELGEAIEGDLDEVPREVPGLPARLPASVSESLPPDIKALVDSLTPRELEILRLLPTGMTDQEIAHALFLAKRTVQTHVAAIYDKIRARNRAEAVAFAVRYGLVAPPDAPPQA